MMGLWADGWFYIASAGLLVSAVLFFFLLGQYRASAEDADLSEPEQSFAMPVAAIRPLPVTEEPAPARASAPPPIESPVEKSVETPVEIPFATPAERTIEQSTEVDKAPLPHEARHESAAAEGASPAAAYLQGIKSQLESLHGDMRDLAARVDTVAGRDEALIEHLIELAQAVAELKGQAAVPSSRANLEKTQPSEPVFEKTPAPAPEPVVEPVVERVAEPVAAAEPAPAVEALPEPKLEIALAPRVDLRPAPEPEATLVLPPSPETSPAPAAETAAVKAKGPVWPV